MACSKKFFSPNKVFFFNNQDLISQNWQEILDYDSVVDLDTIPLPNSPKKQNLSNKQELNKDKDIKNLTQKKHYAPRLNKRCKNIKSIRYGVFLFFLLIDFQTKPHKKGTYRKNFNLWVCLSLILIIKYIFRN